MDLFSYSVNMSTKMPRRKLGRTGRLRARIRRHLTEMYGDDYNDDMILQRYWCMQEMRGW